MTTQLLGMIETLAAWALLFAILFGLGCLVLRLADRRIGEADDVFTAFWLGLGGAIAVLQLWHLVAPVGPRSLALAGGLGGVGLWTCRASLASSAAALRRRVALDPRGALLVLGLFLLFLLWLSNRAMAPVTPQGDSGIYHIGTVRWLQAEPIVPGLGNLFARLAFNNSSHLFLAMLDLGEGPPHFHHVGAPLLFAVFTAQSVLHFGQLLRRRAEVPPRRLMGCLWFAGVVPYFFMELGSTSTDTVNLLLGLVIALHLFDVVFQPERDLGWNAFVCVFLSAIGVTIKLSFAFLGVGVAGVAALAFLQSVRDPGHPRPFHRLAAHRRAVAAALLTVALVGLVWVARGVIMTGYVGFPSNTVLAFDVDWKIPAHQVVFENDNIRSWARYPVLDGTSFDEVLSGWFWLGRWLGNTLLRFDIFTIPMLLFLVSAAASGTRARRRALAWRPALRFLAPAVVAVALWFVTAPAERFGGGIFWWLGAGGVAIYFRETASADHRRLLANACIVGVAALVAVAAVSGAVLSEKRYGWWLIVSPGAEDGFHPFPAVTTTRRVLDSGLAVHVPKALLEGSSEWTPGLYCWDAPLPCVRRPYPDLMPRDPKDVSQGFRLRDGGPTGPPFAFRALGLREPPPASSDGGSESERR